MKAMREIRFYHLTRTHIERALPLLLQKALKAGKRVVVRTISKARVAELDAALWVYEDHSFLPHGSAAGVGHAAHQPIWLTDENENPNQADTLFILDGIVPDSTEGFALCALLFDGNNAQSMAWARDYWRVCLQAGFRLTYWQQTEQGLWKQKETV